jgi:hypothetical protein
MPIDATPPQAQLILGAMRNVATALGAQPLTDTDRAVLAATHHYLFRATGVLDPAALPDTIPVVLHAALEDARLADHAVQLLTAMALVDGTIDAPRVDRVESYAGLVGVTGERVRQLAEIGRRNLEWVAADAQRNNAGAVGQLLESPRNDLLAARYRALADLAIGTLGRAFADFYRTHEFAFPGEADALVETFATPHDSAHVLSGYDTTPAGELLVRAFAAGMHPDEPMSVDLLPVIITWHLGAELTECAGAPTGALDPEEFLMAWERGAATTTDVLDGDWDFWTTCTRSLDDLRSDYAVPPLDPKDAPSDRLPDGYRPLS